MHYIQLAPVLHDQWWEMPEATRGATSSGHRPGIGLVSFLGSGHSEPLPVKPDCASLRPWLQTLRNTVAFQNTQPFIPYFWRFPDVCQSWRRWSQFESQRLSVTSLFWQDLLWEQFSFCIFGFLFYFRSTVLGTQVTRHHFLLSLIFPWGKSIFSVLFFSSLGGLIYSSQCVRVSHFSTIFKYVYVCSRPTCPPRAIYLRFR